jgi:SAM-dependent methyltransferase
MTKPFIDHFGSMSSHYAEARPTYPIELYEWFVGICANRNLAWDCGAGSGQASYTLADYFELVVATDASVKQITQAKHHPKIDYRVVTAEKSGLLDSSVDLITVAQALHWFDFDLFFKEVKRVMKPSGVLAVWSYGRQSIQGDEVNTVFQNFYSQILGRYWPPERHHVEDGYQSIPFPFELVDTPKFEMKVDWTLPQLLAYLRSWSATANFMKANSVDPVTIVESEIGLLWGDANTTRQIQWPLVVRIGRN